MELAACNSEAAADSRVDIEKYQVRQRRLQHLLLQKRRLHQDHPLDRPSHSCWEQEVPAQVQLKHLQRMFHLLSSPFLLLAL